jgi:hypothetical protein
MDRTFKKNALFLCNSIDTIQIHILKQLLGHI